MNWKKILLALSIAHVGVALAATEERPLWMRYPAISPDGQYIAFTYRGDIYKVSTQGGAAVRLTSHSAYECYPVWSPDSKRIAFTSDRNRLGSNIYIMDADGGGAKILTMHSGSEIPYSFTPDGEHILFKAHIQDPAMSTLYPSSAITELYSVPTSGGRPTLRLAIPSEYAVMSADGKRILYHDRKGTENEWRKKHVSSITRDIVEYDVVRKTFRYVINHAGEDRNPVYSIDDKGIYFLSERDGKTMNVYSAQLDGSDVRQLTQMQNEPVRFLSIDRQGTLCFGYAGEIYLLRPGQTAQRVQISITHDVDDTFQERISARSGMSHATVSPDGKLIAFVSRGEVFVTAVDYSTTKRITTTSAEEHGVTFGKDSRSLIYASVRDGYWDLYQAKIPRKDDPNMANATEIIETKLIPELQGEKAYPKISPNGQEVAFVHERERLVVYNLSTKQLRRIMPDGLLQNGKGELRYEWSPDGKWFVLDYVARGHAPYNDVGIVRADGKGELINLTNSGYTDHSPRWALDGQAIIYTTERYGMRNHASWGSMEDVMMIFLNRAAYERYQQSEEDRAYADGQSKVEDKEETSGDKGAKTKGKVKPASKPKAPKETTLELDGLEDRRVRLTPNSSDLADAIVSPDGKKLYYLAAFEGKYDLWMYDLVKRTPKLINKLNAANVYFQNDATGKTIFILGSKAQKLDPKNDGLKEISYNIDMRIDYAAERQAMFAEVEREQALRFYRKDMHGVDWASLTKYYRRYLPHISNNYDFAEMLSELLGELNVSHTGSGYRSPAARAQEPTAELGLFLDWSISQRGLYVEEIVAGGPFDRSTSKLRKGDVITSIDGVELGADTDFFPLLAGKADKPLIVTFRSASSGQEVSERVKPITSDALDKLLYRRWVRQRADMVERLSGGKLGYVHIPSMGDPSFREMYSEALGRYYGRKGIVIDIRNNGGGRLHEDIEVFFGGEQYLQQEIRGRDYCEMPSRRWNHASIMLVCENDYSNAHGTPWVYKHKKMGKVVGMPVPGTMTSVNWVTLQDPTLYFGIPAVGYRTAQGEYLENMQLEPDVLQPLDPIKALEGVDTQLERAVQILLSDIQ